jgi:urease accessory protein
VLLSLSASAVHTAMASEALLSLLQFADGLFPAGGFAHSMGLETYARTETIAGPDEVKALVEVQLECVVAPADAVAMVLALKGAQRCELGAVFELDQILDATKSVAALRNASRQMGRQTARVAAALTEDSRLVEFYRCSQSERTPGHHAVAFGLAGSAMGWDAQAAICAYLYGAAALMVSAAVKLVPLGQLAGQRILWALAPLIARLALQVEGKSVDDMWTFAPALEVAAMRHSEMEAKLFRS